MSILICFLSVFHFICIIQKRVFISKTTKGFIYLGVFLPIGDYILRFILGEEWFQSGNLIFHSFFYQAFFWSIIALLYWVYTRDFKGVFRFYLPLSGLFANMLFCLFSTENLAFFAPLYKTGFHFDLINAGYIIPLTVMLILWATKHWSELSAITISRLSFGFLVFFLLVVSIIKQNAANNLTDDFKDVKNINITPANNLQTEWNVAAYRDGMYLVGRYHFVQGWQGEIKKEAAFDDLEISQNILHDPTIKHLYFNAFKNPVIKMELQNEVIGVTISELRPSVEPLWVKQIQIIKNRSGQIMDINTNFGSIL